LLEGEGSIEDRLKSFSSNFLRGVLQPDVIKLRRLVIGEAGRFPELGRVFYELGPQRANEQLGIALGEAAGRHDLMMNDPEVAAGHLLSLILSKPLDEAMLLGDGFRCTEASLLKIVDEGVRAFLAEYGSSQH
jgi:hypothetical protein